MKLLFAILAVSMFAISITIPAVAAESMEMIAAPAATEAPSAHKAKKVKTAKKAKKGKTAKKHKAREVHNSGAK